MSVAIDGDQAANKLECPDGFLERCNGIITFEGSGSKIIVKEPRNINYFHLLVRNHSTIFVQEGLIAGELIAHSVGEEALIAIGTNNHMNGRLRVTVQESSTVRIGKDCLFANDVEIMCGDAHGMFDAKSGARINLPQDIRIDDHVWVCAKVNILKGAYIGKDSVVGLGSIVTSSSFCPPGSVLAGSPARVVRSGVRWSI